MIVKESPKLLTFLVGIWWVPGNAMSDLEFVSHRIGCIWIVEGSIECKIKCLSHSILLPLFDSAPYEEETYSAGEPSKKSGIKT